MSKDELERSSRQFVVLGIALTSIGILNRYRGTPGDMWVAINSAGCVTVGLMQFLLAYRLHKKAQRLPA
jgi:hypothetical protein